MPVTISDCPHCAARDTVFLENGDHFCPWCLYSWSDSEGLILDRASDAQAAFLEDLARAFETD